MSSRTVVRHRLERMLGRDPRETHRAATPLELLYDLTFAVAFGIAGNQLAHRLAEGHFGAGALGFGFATFAICWTWINFSWFASAFDTDDWAYRIAVMVQMVGVVVMAMGFPAMFASLDEGHELNNATMVLGYVIMRLAMLYLWLRAARECPSRYRKTCLIYAATLLIAQVGWVALVFAHLPLWPTVALIGGLVLVEMSGPVVAESRQGSTPWHAHHIAERYSLLAIITLGEGVIGTVASLSAVLELEHGWTPETFGVAFAGIGLTFGMWWAYFSVDPVPVLERAPKRAFGWGYGHVLIFASIAATGAGLHVAAYYLEHEAHISAAWAVVTVVLPVAVFTMSIFAMYFHLYRDPDRFHLVMLGLTAVLLATPLFMARAGVEVAWCLLVLMLAPVVSVVGYEVWGHRHQEAAVARLRG